MIQEKLSRKKRKQPRKNPGPRLNLHLGLK